VETGRGGDGRREMSQKAMAAAEEEVELQERERGGQ